MKINSLIYRTIRPFGGLQVAKHLTRWHPRIFMYHRVNEGDAHGALNVSVFKEQMRKVKRDFHPVALQDLLGNSSFPSNAVAITFDDGYGDFYDFAFPVLKAEGIPATLFIATGFIDKETWLWPDQIAYILKRTKLSKAEVSPLGAIRLKSNASDAWHRISDYCLSLENKKKIQFIHNLHRQLDVDIPSGAPDEYKPLTWDQIRWMKNQGLDVQSHSHTHPIMSRLSDVELKEELEKPMERINKETGDRPHIFCYPNGMPVDFDVRVKTAVEACGYQYAVAAFPSRKTMSNRWEINRYATSASTETFEKALYGLTRLTLPKV